MRLRRASATSDGPGLSTQSVDIGLDLRRDVRPDAHAFDRRHASGRDRRRRLWRDRGGQGAQESGSLAWLAWAAVHLEFLAPLNLRVSVFLQWVWTYLTG